MWKWIADVVYAVHHRQRNDAEPRSVKRRYGSADVHATVHKNDVCLCMDIDRYRYG